jgi:hypothetical protein
MDNPYGRSESVKGNTENDATVYDSNGKPLTGSAAKNQQWLNDGCNLTDGLSYQEARSPHCIKLRAEYLWELLHGK